MVDNIQMNRAADGVVLPPEVSSEIWSEAQEQSAVMRFANRINLPGPGIQIPTITGDPTASWVDETDEIGVGDSTLGSKTIQGYKLGVIELFSKEFKRDLPKMYAELASRLPGTLAAKFDETVFHGEAPGSNFDVLTLLDGYDLSADNAYDDLVAIEGAISLANGENRGYVLSPRARGVLLSAKDSSGRPLLVNDVQRQGGVSSLLGAPVNLTRAAYKAGSTGVPEVLGFAGDWSQAMYGVVEDIEVTVSSEATINKGGTQVNLFQRDMFAVKVTTHVGFAVRDSSKLVRVTGETPAA